MSSKDTSPLLLTIAETAQRLSCSERHVWRLIKDQEIEVVRHRGITRVPVDSVNEFIRRNTRPRK